MIIDDIHKALDDGRVRHAAVLFMALRHFLEHHPEGHAGLAKARLPLNRVGALAFNLRARTGFDDEHVWKDLAEGLCLAGSLE